MPDIVAKVGASEKHGESAGNVTLADDAVQVLPPAGTSVQGDTVAAVQRLARAQIVPEALLAALDGPLGGAIATAAAYAGSALSEATKRAYARDWCHFAGWCREQSVDPTALPIHPVLVAAYLASLAGTLGRSALNGRLAAIAHEHRRRGLAWNAGHPAIRETLQGVGRRHGKPVRPAAALTSVEIKRLLETCRDDLAGLRDRALFLVGFAGALRRSELVAIDHDHLRFEAGGVTVHIPRSKRDQEGKGADVTLPRMRDATGAASATCPVRALERWLARARIRRGAVFRGVTVKGRLGERLSTDGVRHILLSRAKLAELTVHASERLSPHGLRAGFITEAYLAAAPDELVMAHTRHLDHSTMRGYRRRARITADNPARLLDL
jgi:integrase